MVNYSEAQQQAMREAIAKATEVKLSPPATVYENDHKPVAATPTESKVQNA